MDQDKGIRKEMAKKDSDSRKHFQYRISDNAVETLLENVLTGKTVVLPSEVFRTVTPRNENSTLSLAHKRVKVDNDHNDDTPAEAEPTKGDISKEVYEKENNPSASSDNDLRSFMKVNGSKDQDLVLMLNDAAVERVENGGVTEENDDGRSTRPVTPTGMRPVSEQYIQAKRILNSNPYGVEPPLFQNLPAELEEAFTLSAAYVAQLIISSTSQLNYKLDKLVKSVPSSISEPNVNARACEITASTSSSQADAKASLSSSQKNDSPTENLTINNVVNGNLPKATIQSEPQQNNPPAQKPVYDVFFAFENYLQRIKMPGPEVTAHLNHVRILSIKEANKYMAKFGFTPKKKK